MPLESIEIKVQRSAQKKPKGVKGGVTRKLWADALCRAKLIPFLLIWVGTTKQGCWKKGPEFELVHGLEVGDPTWNYLVGFWGRTRRIEILIKAQEGGQYLDVSASLFDWRGRKLIELRAVVSTWCPLGSIVFNPQILNS